jgi:multiple sugar transport system substrate-binding protein
MMRDVSKKAVVIVLTAVLASGSMFAKSRKSSKKGSTVSYEKYENLKNPKTGKKWDLGGMKIVIADWWSPTTPAAPQNAQEEAAFAFRSWLEKEYNFKIDQVGIDGWGKHPQTFVNFATNGGAENYIFILYQSSIASPMKAGLCYDLATLKSLDFSQPKWQQSIKNLTTVGKHVYGMRVEAPEPGNGIFFNKRMLKEAGIDPESIYDMQEKGTWTWNAFEKICAKLTRDTNNDGVIDVYALTDFTVDYYTSVVASNNATFIGRDKNGKFYNATTTDNFLEAMNWGYNILQKYEMPQPKDSKWDYMYAAFINGEAAMQVAGEYRSGSIKNMKDDYGFVCFPKGPKAGDYTNVYTDNVWVIPSCYDADKAEKLAFAFNLYTEPTPGYEGADDWKTSYYGNFRDTRAVDDTVARLRTNGVPWYYPLVTGINLGDIVYSVGTGGKTPAEQIEAVKNVWQGYIDEANK